MKKTLLLCLAAIHVITSAQTSQPVLKHFWNGLSYPIVLPTKDNSALLIGGFDYWVKTSIYSPNSIIKLDSAGNLVFNKEQHLMASTATNVFSDFNAATLCEGNNFAVVGSFGNYDIYYPSLRGGPGFCIKYNGVGDTIWCRVISDPGFFGFNPTSVSLCHDSALIFCGTAVDTTNLQKAFIGKLNKNGNLQWMKSVKMTLNNCTASSVKQTADSGYIMIGSYVIGDCLAPTEQGTLLWKLDKSGNLEWSKLYCSGQNFCSAGLDVVQFNTDYLCLASSAGSLLFKCDLNGNLAWNRKYLYSGTRLTHITQDKFLISNKSWNATLTDTSGTGHWLVGSGYDMSVCQLKNKNYFMVVDCMNGSGNALYENGLAILNSTAGFTTSCVYSSTVSIMSATMSTSTISCTLNNSGILSGRQLTSYTPSLSIHQGCYYDSGTGLQQHGINQGINIYPNPAQDYFDIGPVSTGDAFVELINVMGQSIMKQRLIAGQKTSVDIAILPEGTYYYRTYSGYSTINTGKLIIIR